MDLAEIRKKARRAKAEGRTAPPMPPEPSGKDPGPRPTEVARPPSPSPTPAETRVLERRRGEEDTTFDERLEQLFAFSGDIDFASEESYQQGLTGDTGEEAEDLCQWLTFSLGAEEYALDIRQIKEIIKPRQVTEIPRVPEFILGVISLRGIIVPVFDLSRRLRLGSADLTASSRIVVCRAGERSAGLLVDRISQVIRIPVRSIEPPPVVLSGLDRELVAGVGRHQSRMLIQLYLPNVLNPELV
jgi:purine-binding chemotaxis protein CheW